MTLSIFSISSFFNAILVTVLADFGDKTWVLVVALAAWCPWCGNRSSNSVGLISTTYALVFLGTTAVLILRTLLMLVGVNPFNWDGFCEVVSSILVFFIAIKATVDYRLVVVDETYRRRDAPVSVSTVPRPAIQDDPEGYGATSSGGSAAPKSSKTFLEEPPEGWTQALLTAMVLPSLSVFFTEAGDRSEGVLNTGNALPLDIVVGAAVGFAISVAAAMTFGYILSRQLAEQWLLFGIDVAMWLLCFCCIRDTFMHLMIRDISSLT
mmetsp:Transcript_117057/g.303564  ORF Transcript_117057/g.303564 Transcript_117057/m.303564 type:complete len:266 (+) Transcript_117057:102-899(+)